jgi:signal transduction histidine kinase
MRTNRTILARCLNNLIWNAVQAMPAGGLLEITGTAERERVVLTVSDTGGGIPKEMQEKIFRTSLSTKRGHRGMGLTLVRSLVRRSGGEIVLVDRPGCGAVFALAFPVAERESHSREVPAYGKGHIEVG